MFGWRGECQEQPSSDLGARRALVQRREEGSPLSDPLYMADRRWSSGQGPDDRVTPQLDRWYDLEFELATPALGNRLLTATLGGEPIEASLDLLAGALDVIP